MTAWLPLAGLPEEDLLRAARRRASVILADGRTATLTCWPKEPHRSPLVRLPGAARSHPVLAHLIAGIDADHALLPHRPRRRRTRKEGSCP